MASTVSAEREKIGPSPHSADASRSKRWGEKVKVMRRMVVVGKIGSWIFIELSCFPLEAAEK